MRTRILLTAAALLLTGGGVASAQAPATATPGKALDMVLVPKFLATDKIGRLFDQAHDGAEQAARELKNPRPLLYTGPVLGHDGASQTEIVASAAAVPGVKAIMLSNNSGDAIVPALKAARAKGIKVVTWDFAVPSAEGEDVYVAHIDVAQGGPVLADMARAILPNGGPLAVLSNSPDSPAPNLWVKGFQAALQQPADAALKQVDLAYGNDDAELGVTQALALLDKHPDLKLIVAPTSNSLLAAAQAVQARNLCDKVKVTGFGLPSDMRDYVRNGCVPRFALWSFTDLGYLAYYTTYLLATNAIKAQDGQRFTAGRLGQYTITKDPMRPRGLRVLLGPWTVFDRTTIDVAAR